MTTEEQIVEPSSVEASESDQQDKAPADEGQGQKSPRRRTPIKINPDAPLVRQQNPATRGISVPSYTQAVQIKTLQAQKVMSRVFSRASNSLYRIDVILRVIGSEDAAEQVEQVISDEINEATTALKSALDRVKVVMDTNGITEPPSYDLVFNEEVRIISPHVARFVNLVRMLDEIITCIDALWLNSIVNNKDRNDEVYLWQQRIMKLGSRIITIESRARESARAQGKQEEVDREAPIQDVPEEHEEVQSVVNG